MEHDKTIYILLSGPTGSRFWFCWQWLAEGWCAALERRWSFFLRGQVAASAPHNVGQWLLNRGLLIALHGLALHALKRLQ